MSRFTVKVDNLHWLLEGSDEDLCLHGHAITTIGSERFEYDATVSATGLYLLKSITEDHVIYEDNQMLPCCGHFMIPDDALTSVTICGCPNGIDWSVLHVDGSVRLITDSGQTVDITPSEYAKEVIRLADQIEAFYRASAPKIIEDQYDRDCYTAFWNEWHRRRTEAELFM